VNFKPRKPKPVVEKVAVKAVEAKTTADKVEAKPAPENNTKA